MRRWVASALLGVSALAFGADPVTLEIETWPAKRACEPCIPIQFGTLEMHIPLADIGKIVVLTVGSEAAVNLSPKTGEPSDILVLIETELEKGRHGEKFFDQLGKVPVENKAIASLRRVYGIDTAARYTKASKDSLHVYWVRSNERKLNAIYFVTEGSNRTFLLGGPITQAFYESLLANLRVTRIP
jgi:hypothetical protein